MPLMMSAGCVEALNDHGPAVTPPHERRAAACRAELRDALQQWAAEARRREAEADWELRSRLSQRTRHEVYSPAESTPDNRPSSADSAAFPPPAAAPATAAAPAVAAPAASASVPVPPADAAVVSAAATALSAVAPALPSAAVVAAVDDTTPVSAPAAAPDSSALLCSAAWRRAALARAAASVFVGRAVRRNVTSLARIEAGVDAVCRGVREVEARLVGECSHQGSAGGEGGKVLADEAGGATGAGAGAGAGEGEGAGAGGGAGEGEAAAKCGTWPEACWPVPHMPFADAMSVRARKLLVFAYSEEQLSNTRSHLAEAARVAQATNRTLVLPKASHSRLSLDRALPLCTYFDLSRLDAHWISPELFLLLARVALIPPVSSAAAPAAGPSVAFLHVQANQTWRRPFRPLVDMLSELMVYGMGHAPAKHNTVDVLMPANNSAILHMLYKWRHTDVLVWVKSTFHRVPFHPPTNAISLQMLPYSQAWHAMAHRAMARLPPRYIAVHYRSEFIAFHLVHKLAQQGLKAEAGVLDELMTGCMEAARDLINGMKRRHHISAVFIAADVPLDERAGCVVRSDSWKDTTWMFDQQERALQAPREKLRWLREQVEGTVMVDELLPAIDQYDPGIVAIVDKLLCAHAHIFLAGSVICGGTRGFEEDITSHRVNLNNTFLRRWLSPSTHLLQQLNLSSAGVG
ncbi:unnamed protein product [Closterium sp. NIES-65]|nr:unnamed protein product [Closterium sp. NIES-65]